MASDLLYIGSSGLLSQQKMLNTTSNNISNVSTQGYVRQSTVLYTNTVGLGVGDSTTRRLYDTYAQAQVWADTSNYNENNTAYTELSQLDTYLSDSTTSLYDGIDSFFSSLQSANSSPNTAATRQNILAQLDSLTSRFNSVSDDLSTQYSDISGKISTTVDDVNTTLKAISDLNDEILKTPSLDDDGTRANLLDQRDELVRQLSEKLDIKTVAQENGTVQVNLSTGHTLVLPDAGGYATLSAVAGDPDPQQTVVQLQLGQSTTKITTNILGGELEGYFTARDTISDAQKEIGQLSLAFADAMNTQNGLGMTLNNELGGDLFSLPSSVGMAYSTNTGTGSVTASVIAGEGMNVPSNDFMVEYTAAGVDIYVLDGKTKTSVYSGAITSPINLSNPNEDYGLSFDIGAGGAVGDKFLIQPTKNAASSVTTTSLQPEDIALASPLALSSDENNYGSGVISLTSLTDTTTSFSSNSLLTTAPHSIVVNASGGFDIYDGTTPTANLLGTSTSKTNILSVLGTDPGFDVSISGTVVAGDTFTIGFNTDGFSDNTNGLALAGLQTQDLVRKGSSTAADNKMTFSEAYSATLTAVGTQVSNLKTSTDAAEAKLTQSQTVYESTAGVNLDEEAANLVRYQQAYSASAKVIAAAKETFNTLLGAVGS